MSSPRAHPWQAVADELRGLIDQGKLAVGDNVPTEQELVERHGLGRSAVRRALRDLESHGLITAGRGSQGRRVREFAPRLWNLSRFEVGQRRDDPDLGVDEWAADMREQGCVPSETVVTFGSAAPVRVARAIELTTGDRVYVRRRYRYADGELVSIADTWMPEWMAERPATSENGELVRDKDGKILYPFQAEYSLSLPGGLIRAVGLRQSWVEDLHYSRHPRPDEAEKLGSSEPVAEMMRIGYDRQDHPFRVMLTISPGHRLAARYVLKVEDDE